MLLVAATGSIGNVSFYKTRGRQGGARRWYRAHLSFVVATFFENRIELKRYVGGLVHPMDQPLHIALLGFRSDDVVSASLFERLSVSDETRSTSNR